MNLKVYDNKFDAKKHNALVDLANSAQVKQGVGYTVNRNVGGTVLNIKPGKGGTSSSSHPFKVSIRLKGESETEWEAMVELNSSLYKSLRPNDKVAITGLDDWFDLISNDAIWLGVTFDDSGEVDWVGIDSWGQTASFNIDENAWSGNDGYCEDDGESEDPKHQTSRKLIAYTVAGDEGQPVLTQVMFHDQLLRDCNIDGRPARYPFDHSGGYPIS